MTNMNKVTYFLAVGLLVLAPFTKAFSSEESTIKKEASIPTCFMKSDAAIAAALNNTERQAINDCGGPVSLSKVVDITVNPASSQNACGNVEVVAEYYCN